MKKIIDSLFVLIFCFSLSTLYISCEKDFRNEYNEIALSKKIKIDSYAKENQDYFVSIEDDGELSISPDNMFPCNVVASKALYNDKVLITWSPIVAYKNLSVRYRVYKKEVGLKENKWKLLSEQQETTYIDLQTNENQLEGKIFLYGVRAVYHDTILEEQTNPDGTIEKKYVDFVSASRLSYFDNGYILSNIIELKASFREEYDRIQLFWGPVDGAKNYAIYRAEPTAAGDEAIFDLVATTKNCNYTDYSQRVLKSSHNLVAGKEYSYKVFPVNEANVMAQDSPKTLVVLGAFLAVGAPVKPNLKRVSKAEYGNGVLLEWEAIKDSHFKVYRATSPFGPFALVEAGIEGNCYLDKLSNVDTKDKSGLFYYRISSQNAVADSPLSDFDEEIHCGYLFYLHENNIIFSKSIYPKGIYISSSASSLMTGDKLYLQYSTDKQTWEDVNQQGLTLPFSIHLLSDIQNYESEQDYFFRFRTVKNDLVDSSLFGDEDSLKGKSNLVFATAKKGGPLLPSLNVSLGDHSIAGKIAISGKWDIPEYGDYVDIALYRFYTFGKERTVVSKPIEVVQKQIVGFGDVHINNGEFRIIDSLTPDINPTDDTILPMNATIKAGEGWSYWSWDREAWKYLKRKLPFDMKKAVGCDYKIVVRWKGADDSWEQSSPAQTSYGFPALSDEEFAHLGLWLREVAMNRLWHIYYPPYVGSLSTTIEVLTSPQTKYGEYCGEVGFTAKADGLGGSGKCWIRNYSDWGEDYRINLEKENESFDIVLKYKEVAAFDMPLSIKTPLYEGHIHALFNLENGLYCDKPKAGSYMIVTQKGRPSMRYDNLEQEGSLVTKYFPPLSYEQRKNPSFSGVPSFELTTINFKYPIDEWVAKRNEDWVMYYGFKFE